jgi:hypothetical protein
MSLQTKFAAEAHLAQGQFLLERKTLNKDTSLIYRVGNGRPAVSKREGQNSEAKPGNLFVETSYFSA